MAINLDAAKSAGLPAATRLERRDAEARQDRDYTRADELRDRIWAAGFDVEDLPEGTRVKRRH